MDYSSYKQVEFRRKFWRFFGASIDVIDPATQNKIGFIEMKAWKLKEDIRLYTDNSKQHEILRIHARTIIDFGATYDVFDSASSEPLFSLRRKGLRSAFVRDHWNILGVNGETFATVQETSGTIALIRRYIGIIPLVGDIAELILIFAPMSYRIDRVTPAEQSGLVATLIHRKNPLVVKMSLDTSTAQAAVDPRINIAIASMLSVLDAKKS